MKRTFAILLAFVLLLPVALAVNDPGHDSLYVLRIGDTNVTGTINITANLTATLVQATSRFFGPNIDIRGDGTSTANANQIVGTTSNLEVSSSGLLILNKAVTGGMVYVGWSGTTTTLNVSGNLIGGGTATFSGNVYDNNNRVCTASNGLCTGGGTTANNAGWLNVSNQVYLANNNTNVTVGAFPVLYIDTTYNRTGILTSVPGAALDVNGTINATTIQTGGTTRIGSTGVGTFATGTTINSRAICLSDGTNCAGVGNTSGGTSANNAGWLNTTDQNYLANNNTNVTIGAFPLLYIDTTYNRTGILTSVPGAALDVNGTINATTIQTGGTTRIGSTGVGTFATGTTINSRAICLSDGTNCAAISNSSNSGAANNAGWLNSSNTVWLSNNATNITAGYVGNAPVLFVDTANGRAGIGVNTTGATFDVAGTLNATTIQTSGTTRLSSTGVGTFAATTTVNGKAICLSDGTNCAAITNGSGGGGATNAGWLNASDVVYLNNNNTNVTIGNVSGYPTVLFIDTTNGRVGIRNTTPQHALDIWGILAFNGTATIDSARIGTFATGTTINSRAICLSDGSNCAGIGNTSGGVASNNAGWINSSNTVWLSSNTTNVTVGSRPSLFVDTTNGRVGVNTTSPSQALQVSGNINVTNTTISDGCMYVPGGGRVCGNATCTIVYSPNGNTIMQSCN